MMLVTPLLVTNEAILVQFMSWFSNTYVVYGCVASHTCGLLCDHDKTAFVRGLNHFCLQCKLRGRSSSLMSSALVIIHVRGLLTSTAYNNAFDCVPPFK